MNQRTRIKFCGFREAEDVAAAVSIGADALGFVFYPPSPRALAPADAATLIRSVPPFVTTTGLLVNPDRKTVDSLLAEVPLDLLQFHGDEDDAFCRQFGRPFIKAVRVHPDMDLATALDQWPSASGLLLDAWHPEQPGGTGLTFDWQRIPLRWRRRIILAGGLTPDNVGQAVRTIRPYGVDVSGGIEQHKGKKDSALMAAFAAAVQHEDTYHD